MAGTIPNMPPVEFIVEKLNCRLIQHLYNIYDVEMYPLVAPLDYNCPTGVAEIFRYISARLDEREDRVLNSQQGFVRPGHQSLGFYPAIFVLPQRAIRVVTWSTLGLKLDMHRDRDTLTSFRLWSGPCAPVLGQFWEQPSLKPMYVLDADDLKAWCDAQDHTTRDVSGHINTPAKKFS